MYRDDVIKFFGGTRQTAAKALDISEQAISLWGEVVPEGRAYKIESKTKGKLKVKTELYEGKRAVHCRTNSVNG